MKRITRLKALAYFIFLVIAPAIQAYAAPVKSENSDNPLMHPLIVYDTAFQTILGKNPQLTRLAEGFIFTEGPIYFSNKKGSDDGYLLFTDIMADTTYAIHWFGLQPFNQLTPLSWSAPVVFRHTPSAATGQTADLNGNLLTAEQMGRRISITAADGSIKTLIGFYQGKPFNSPNDLVVKSDGSVWFTDPTYGCPLLGTQCYLPNNVYRYDPKTDEITVVIKGLIMPNGIAFSIDEKKLYVIDSGAGSEPGQYIPNSTHSIDVYNVNPDGKTLSNPKIFAQVTPGFPDGMRLDTNGNIYVGALDGVHVINPTGKLIGKIALPKQTANLTFGGKDNNILFIGSASDLWAIKLTVHGAAPIRTLSSSVENS